MSKNRAYFIAIFKDGYEIAFSAEEFENRLAVYNCICKRQFGKGHGELVEIKHKLALA